MDYLTTKCLSYVVGLSELCDKDSSEILNVFAPIFLLDEDRKNSLINVIKSNTFNTLFSSKAIEQYQNYISSFCADSFMFGNNVFEYEALEIKKSALKFIERFASGTNIKIERQKILAQNHENVELISFVYGLLLYLTNKNESRIYNSIFTTLSQNGFADAIIINLYLDNVNVKNKINQLAKTSEMCLNSETFNLISQHYGVTYKAELEDSNCKTFFRR